MMVEPPDVAFLNHMVDKTTSKPSLSHSAHDQHDEGLTRFTVVFAFLGLLLFVTAMAYAFKGAPFPQP
jgi:hypothetical protein